MIININIDEKSKILCGRDLGKSTNQKYKLLENIKSGNTFNITISDDISYVSDSFWKGLLGDVFNEYKTIDKVTSFLNFTASDTIKRSLDENLKIFEAIFNFENNLNL